jgi:cytidine deaminase
MLSDAEDKMLQQAKDVANNAYTKYSKFGVGAVILSSTGEMFCGCNIENASFGLTICAERVAIFNAISLGFRDFKEIIIYTPNKLAYPCGACLQVMVEFAPEMEVVAVTDKEIIRLGKANELLPKYFRLES